MECTHQRLLEIRQTNDRQTWCVNLGREKNGRYVYVHLPNFEGHVASVPSSPRHPQVLLTSWYAEMDWSDLVSNSHWTSENGYRNQAKTIVTIHCFSRMLLFYLVGVAMVRSQQLGALGTAHLVAFFLRSSKRIGACLILFQGSYYPLYTLKITTTHILGFPANHHRFSNVPKTSQMDPWFFGVPIPNCLLVQLLPFPGPLLDLIVGELHFDPVETLDCPHFHGQCMFIL